MNENSPSFFFKSTSSAMLTIEPSSLKGQRASKLATFDCCINDPNTFLMSKKTTQMAKLGDLSEDEKLLFSHLNKGKEII